jgi:integrase
MKVRAHKKGSVVFNKLRSTWNFLWVENGQRKSRKLGTLAELPTKAKAESKADACRRDLRLLAERAIPTVKTIVQQYRSEKLSRLRPSTQRAAESWLQVHILPRWESSMITDLQPRPVELWLDSLPLAPRTRGHIRELLHRLVDFSMWASLIPLGVNPISLVTVRGSSKRKRQPRSLKVEEFHAMLKHLPEPIRTMALVQVCLGLRVSEPRALRSKDVDWIGSEIQLERGIVQQHVDECKTEGSRRGKFLDSKLLAVLQSWKQSTEFHESDDWIFASPVKLGRLPISYTWYKETLQAAAKAVGITGVGTHCLRHSYRSWLDAAGTPITVQRQSMRHSSITTTLDTYGAIVTDEVKQAESKVAGLALPDFRVISASASA